MGRPIKDLSGKNFKYIHVVDLNKVEDNKTFWNCTCTLCGKQFIATNSTINKAIACGCLKGKTIYKWQHHGNPKLYKKWNHMLSRCNNLKDISYQSYGGRGIQVSSEWRNYDRFYEWAMANGYDEGLEIDRIDVNGNYEPSNCRFVTNKQNRRNLRRTKYYIYNGEKLSLADIAEKLGVNYKTLWQQLTRDNNNKFGLIEIKET